MTWHLTLSMFLMSTMNSCEKPIGAYCAYLLPSAVELWIRPSQLPGDASGTRDFSKAWCSTSTVHTSPLCFNLSKDQILIPLPAQFEHILNERETSPINFYYMPATCWTFADSYTIHNLWGVVQNLRFSERTLAKSATPLSFCRIL